VCVVGVGAVSLGDRIERIESNPEQLSQSAARPGPNACSDLDHLRGRDLHSVRHTRSFRTMNLARARRSEGNPFLSSRETGRWAVRFGAFFFRIKVCLCMLVCTTCTHHLDLFDNDDSFDWIDRLGFRCGSDRRSIIIGCLLATSFLTDTHQQPTARKQTDTHRRTHKQSPSQAKKEMVLGFGILGGRGAQQAESDNDRSFEDARSTSSSSPHKQGWFGWARHCVSCAPWFDESCPCLWCRC
jgi:hypothetical protein